MENKFRKRLLKYCRKLDIKACNNVPIEMCKTKSSF